ncbi:NTP transferase domain-containing protein [Candidatus Berkelbacteria bacterium]|nr:NTP transferase domain-containing protein [Candidatus Berkelbacteria bacterium]
MQSTQVIIMAAGKGSRLKSDLPKALVAVAGIPMLGRVLATVTQNGWLPPLVVVGHTKQPILDYLLEHYPAVQFVEQSELDGTGGAVRVALPSLDSTADYVIALSADNPLITRTTLEHMIATMAAREAVAGVITYTIYEHGPRGYVELDAQNLVTRVHIVDDVVDAYGKDYVLGITGFRRDWLVANIDRLQKNHKNEYPLPELINHAVADHKKTIAIRLPDPQEAWGVNTPEDLAKIEHFVRTNKVQSSFQS